jgi:hypothetical protein
MKLNSKYDFLRKLNSKYDFSNGNTNCTKISQRHITCNASDYNIVSKHPAHKNLNTLDEHSNHIYSSKQQYISAINGNKCL